VRRRPAIVHPKTGARGRRFEKCSVSGRSHKLNRSIAQQTSGGVPQGSAARSAVIPREPVPWALLTMLSALGALLRAIGLNQGLWFDEIITLINSIRPPLLQILTEFSSNNQHPLYSVMGHFSMLIFGEHPWSLRLPAYLFGVAAIPMAYAVGRRFASRTEALLASGFLTISYHHIWFSQNARGYTMLAFFTLLATFLFIRALETQGSRYFFRYALVAALGVYTHLTMVFVVLSHAFLSAVLMLLPRTRGAFRQPNLVTAFVLAGLLSVLFYAPFLADVHEFFSEHRSWPELASPKWALLESLRGLRVGLGTAVAASGACLLLVIGLWNYCRQSLLAVGIFVIPGILMITAAIVMNRPVFPRFLFFLIGFGLLVLVRGAMRSGELLSRGLRAAAGMSVSGNRLGIVVVALMMVVSASTLRQLYRYPKQDFEQAMQYVNSQVREPDIVATLDAASIPYRRYYLQPWEKVKTVNELEDLRTPGRSVWLVYTLPDRIRGKAPDLMQVVEKDFALIRIFPGTLNGGEVIVRKADPPVVKQK